MCTVTFVPQDKETFFITSNRDESPHRSPSKLSVVEHNGLTLVYPRDTLAGGTWIAAGPQRTLCLLNGSFESHHKKSHYRLSRGLMALHYFDYQHALDFVHQFDFTGIEPFTLLLMDVSGFFEFRWDDRATKYLKHLSLQHPQMWSSSTLYSPEIRRWRQALFDQWCLNQSGKPLLQEDIIHFHRFGSSGDDHNGFVMNRKEVVKTVSITSLKISDSGTEVFYEDLINWNHDHYYTKTDFLNTLP